MSQESSTQHPSPNTHHPFVIDAMHPEDWPAVRRIYQAGIDTKLATFETRAPQAWETWSAGKRPECRFVARDQDGLVWGWAVLSPVSKRSAYRGVAEVSIYIDPAAKGRGLGSMLMEALIEGSEAAGIWTLTASIFPENEASIYLHQKHGFKILGRRERIAQLDGVWRDTVVMERRSLVVGGG